MKATKKTGCTFTLTGEVTEIYNGNKNDFVTVKSARGQYYDLFRVAFEKGSGVEVGDNVTVSGRAETFWNKEKKISVVNLYAETVREAL